VKAIVDRAGRHERSFVLDLPTRKLGDVLPMLLNDRVSPSTVSQVSKTIGRIAPTISTATGFSGEDIDFVALDSSSCAACALGCYCKANYAKAVHYLSNTPRPTHLPFRPEDWHRRTRATNAIERPSVEAAQYGFHRTTMDCLLDVFCTHENKNPQTPTFAPLIQNSRRHRFQKTGVDPDAGPGPYSYCLGGICSPPKQVLLLERWVSCERSGSWI
jgi:hypothetical protein